MPKYICKNECCRLYNKVMTRDSKLKFDGHSVNDSGAVCPDCNHICESVIKKDGFTTYMHGSPNICKK